MATLRSAGFRVLMRVSPTLMEPSVTDSKPAIMRRVEVLPQPEEPTRPTISPSLMRRVKSFTAWVGGSPFCEYTL